MCLDLKSLKIQSLEFCICHTTKWGWLINNKIMSLRQTANPMSHSLASVNIIYNDASVHFGCEEDGSWKHEKVWHTLNWVTGFQINSLSEFICLWAARKCHSVLHVWTPAVRWNSARLRHALFLHFINVMQFKPPDTQVSRPDHQTIRPRQRLICFCGA